MEIGVNIQASADTTANEVATLTAKLKEALVLVLHAFEKKTQQTSQRDIDLAAQRLKNWKT